MATEIKNHVISTKNERISSVFGWRNHPITGEKTHHDGMDIIDAGGLHNTTDVKVLAFSDGVVLFAGFNSLLGNYVDILHKNNILTRYFHQKTLLVQKSEFVSKGQELGIMGTTGDSTGVHLHFALKEGSTSSNDGVYVDPMPYLKGEKVIEEVIDSSVPGETKVIISTSDNMPLYGAKATDTINYTLSSNNFEINLNTGLGVTHNLSFNSKSGYIKPDSFKYTVTSEPKTFNAIYERVKGPQDYYSTLAIMAKNYLNEQAKRPGYEWCTILEPEISYYCIIEPMEKSTGYNPDYNPFYIVFSDKPLLVHENWRNRYDNSDAGNTYFWTLNTEGGYKSDKTNEKVKLSFLKFIWTPDVGFTPEWNTGPFAFPTSPWINNDTSGKYITPAYYGAQDQNQTGLPYIVYTNHDIRIGDTENFFYKTR